MCLLLINTISFHHSSKRTERSNRTTLFSFIQCLCNTNHRCERTRLLSVSPPTASKFLATHSFPHENPPEVPHDTTQSRSQVHFLLSFPNHHQSYNRAKKSLKVCPLQLHRDIATVYQNRTAGFSSQSIPKPSRLPFTAI